MKNITLLIAIAALLLVSCKKTQIKATVINGLVRNAVTNLPMSDVEVRLIEDDAGFPFSSAKIIETMRTDANGKFKFERRTNENLVVAIGPNNEYITTAVTYPQIVNHETNIELGKTNDVLLTPANYGFIQANIVGNLSADSIEGRFYHTSVNPSNFNQNFWLFEAGVNDIGDFYEKITGKYVYEYYKYTNGTTTHHFDTITISKGQTTHYELHF